MSTEARLRGEGSSPVAETADALVKIASCLVFGIDFGLDVDLGERAGDAAAEVLGEGVVVAKGRLTPLPAMGKQRRMLRWIAGTRAVP